MSAATRVLVLRAPGINCDEETAFTWELAGATTERIHINRLIENPARLRDFQIITFPGGFSYGDDIAGGKILANLLRHHLADALADFLDRGGLLLGICNGFQVLVRAGLLPGNGIKLPAVTLTWNDSARYEDRWVRLRAEQVSSPFFQPGDEIEMPVAHGEGRLDVEQGETGLTALETASRVAFRYIPRHGDGPVRFPDNPNGSVGNVAGLIDATGRVLGIMPHPERNIFAANAPVSDGPDNTGMQGRRIFERAVQHFAN